MGSTERTPQATSLGSLGRSGYLVKGRRKSPCGRCGRLISARKGGVERYCHDCVKVDPVFCGWATQEEV